MKAQKVLRITVSLIVYSPDDFDDVTRSKFLDPAVASGFHREGSAYVTRRDVVMEEEQPLRSAGALAYEVERERNFLPASQLWTCRGRARSRRH